MQTELKMVVVLVHEVSFDKELCTVINVVLTFNDNTQLPCWKNLNA